METTLKVMVEKAGGGGYRLIYKIAEDQTLKK